MDPVEKPPRLLFGPSFSRHPFSVAAGFSLKTSYVRSFAVGVCVCLSDRYKMFVDLLDMSTYVVPRQCTPQLTQRVRRNLSVAAIGQQPPDELPFDDDDDDDLTSSSNLAKLLIY